MQTIQSTVVPVVIDALTTVKDKLEANDQGVLAREKVWSKEEQAESDGNAAPVEGQIVKIDGEPKSDIEKFQRVSFELLDIGLYYAEKGVSTVKSYPLYQKLDAQVGLDDKFALVLNTS